MPDAPEKRITQERVDELLAYLPAFEAPTAIFVQEWIVKEGTFPYPRYTEDVVAFYTLAGQPCWSDYRYDPRVAGKMVCDDRAIAGASLSQVKTMLTFCVRGERFSDGHWGQMLKLGRVQALLHRLAELRETIP